MREFGGFLLSLARAIAWCWSGGRITFFIAVLFLTIGRLSKVASMFLPIKILLVLSSGGTSRYMQLIPMDPDKLLIFMAAAIPVFYGAAVVCASGHRHAIDRARPAARPLATGSLPKRKFPPLYEMCVASASHATIVAIAVGLAFLLSPTMGLVNLAIVAAYVTFFVYVIMPKPYRHVSWGRLHSTQVMEYLGILGFFLGFLAIAGLVLRGDLEVYGAILSLMMCRLMIRSIKSFLQSAHRNIRGGGRKGDANDDYD